MLWCIIFLPSLVIAETPGKLLPYQLDRSVPGDHDVIVMELETPSIGLSHLMGQHQNMQLQVFFYLIMIVYIFDFNKDLEVRRKVIRGYAGFFKPVDIFDAWTYRGIHRY